MTHTTAHTTEEDAMRQDIHDGTVGQPTGTSVMGDYFAGIGRVALLSAQEEVSLAEAIEVGLFAEHLLASCPDLAPVQRFEYGVLVREGRAARDRMIEANLRLVVHLAKRCRWVDADLFLELVQEGNIGLIRAVERYDYRRGVRFATMASHWILQGFGRVWGMSRGIRLPWQIADAVRKVSAAESALRDTLRREPTQAEVAAALGESPQRVADLIVLGRELASLNTAVGEDGTELGELIVDAAAPAPDEALLSQDLVRSVRAVVDRLPDAYRAVARVRYGIPSGRPASLAETAEILGMSQARVRQMEGKMLSWLRHPSRAKMLHGLAA